MFDSFDEMHCLQRTNNTNVISANFGLKSATSKSQQQDKPNGGLRICALSLHFRRIRNLRCVGVSARRHAAQHWIYVLSSKVSCFICDFIVEFV